MNFNKSIFYFSFILVLGCKSEYPDGMPKLYPVTISLTIQGAPVSEAYVRLKPLDTGNIWSSGLQTDQQGEATIKTHGKFPGAPAGKYKLLVSKTLVEGERPPGELELAENPNLPKPPPQKFFHEIPLLYDDPKQTPFELEVKPGNNCFTFDVPERVKIEIRPQR